MMEAEFTGNQGDKVRSDCAIRLEIKESGGLELQLQSKVERIFGTKIRKQVSEVLQSLGLNHAKIIMKDSGALPFVIAARLEAAVENLMKGGKSYVPEILPQNISESKKDRTRFSRLYLPGNSPAMMLNAGIHQPDGIILDLEDSVAPAKKAEARLLVRNALCQVDFYGAERMVRINQLPAGLEDLDYVVPYYVHVVLIPKCEAASQVREVDERIQAILRRENQKREIFLMPIIESCLGLENAFEIAKASKRLVGLAIGLEDFTADLGVARTAGGQESLYARSRLVNACKAAGIQAIDSVFSDVGDIEGLRENVRQSRSLGFEGMGCIHPRQVGVIHEGFIPSENEIKKAEQIEEAFAGASARGLGVISIGSKMIDPPVVKRAQKTMELAYRFGRRIK